MAILFLFLSFFLSYVRDDREGVDDEPGARVLLVGGEVGRVAQNAEARDVRCAEAAVLAHEPGARAVQADHGGLGAQEGVRGRDGAKGGEGLAQVRRGLFSEFRNEGKEKEKKIDGIEALVQ